jgi:hypothetical protein
MFDHKMCVVFLSTTLIFKLFCLDKRFITLRTRCEQKFM